MKQVVEKQLKDLVQSLKESIETRDLAAFLKCFNPKGVINTFGDFWDMSELSSALSKYRTVVEEVAVSIGNLTSFKESSTSISASFSIEISFVETTNWILKRYSLNVSLQFVPFGKKWIILNLLLNNLQEIGIHKPDFLTTEGVSKINTVGNFYDPRMQMQAMMPYYIMPNPMMAYCNPWAIGGIGRLENPFGGVSAQGYNLF